MAARAWVIAVAAAITLLTLSGCTTAAPTETDDAGAVESAPMPEFAGPYAAEFEEAWVGSDDPFVRGVLQDERISDQEWAEVGTRLGRCLESKGMTLEEFPATGGYTSQIGSLSADAANEASIACEIESGERWLNYLRNAAITNPENVDHAELMVACLLRADVVEPGYTEERFREDYMLEVFPFADPVQGDAALRACDLNPVTAYT